MMGINKCSLLLKQCTIREVHTKLLEFPTRYHHFQLANQKNIWKCQIISDNFASFVIQLTDLTFEIPRGQVSSDQPHIGIRMTQRSHDVEITFSFIGQKYKVVCVIAGMIVYFASAATLICVSAVGSKSFFAGILFLLTGLIFTTIWLVRNIRHDRLTKKVFLELIQRNFSVDCG